MRKAMVLGALAVAGTLASPVFAQSFLERDEFTGFRGGLAISQDTFKSFVDYTVAENVADNRFGYSIFGGWALNKWLAFEAWYHHGSEFNHDYFFDPFADPDHTLKSETDLNALSASVIGSYWFNPHISIYGRAGIYAWKGDTVFIEDLSPDDLFIPTRTSFEQDGNEMQLGIGLQSQLDGALIRLEFSRVDAGDINGTALSFGDTTLDSLTFSIVWKL